MLGLSWNTNSTLGPERFTALPTTHFDTQTRRALAAAAMKTRACHRTSALYHIGVYLSALLSDGIIAPRAPDRPRTELRGGLGATLKPGVSESID